MRLKCQAVFEANNPIKFGFYGPKGEPSRRIKHGEIFYYECDSLPELKEVNGDLYIAKWIKLLDKPKKKPGPKVKNAA